MNKFKKIYTRGRTGNVKNRLGLLRTGEGGKRATSQEIEIILKSSPLRCPKIRIYPGGNYGDALAN